MEKKHTSKELRHLADELWSRGFKGLSDLAHEMARRQDEEDREPSGFSGYLRNELNSFNELVRRELGN